MPQANSETRRLLESDEDEMRWNARSFVLVLVLVLMLVRFRGLTVRKLKVYFHRSMMQTERTPISRRRAHAATVRTRRSVFTLPLTRGADARQGRLTVGARAGVAQVVTRACR